MYDTYFVLSPDQAAARSRSAYIKTIDGALSYKLSPSMTITLDGNNQLNSACHDDHGVPELPPDRRRYVRATGLALRRKH
jgi:hypothetical protein